MFKTNITRRRLVERMDQLTKFIQNNYGKKIDYDGRYGYQCVDLFRLYLRDCLKIDQTPPVYGAKDIWTNCGPLKKRHLAFLLPGDILVYGPSKGNEYGHVCILVQALTADLFIVLEQDGFTQKGVQLNLKTTKDLLGGLYY